MNLTERFDAAYPLACQYAQKLIRLEEIGTEKRNLINPPATFSSPADVERYTRERADFEERYTALDNEQNSIEAWQAGQRAYTPGSLFWLLAGDIYEEYIIGKEHERVPDFAIVAEGYQFSAGDGELWIKWPEREKLPYEQHSVDFVMGVVRSFW